MICCSRCPEILLGSKITWLVLKETPHSNSFRFKPLVSISTPLKCNGLPLTNDRWKKIPAEKGRFPISGDISKMSISTLSSSSKIDSSTHLLCHVYLILLATQKKMAKFLSRWFLWRSTVVSAPIELGFFWKHLLTYQTWRRLYLTG